MKLKILQTLAVLLLVGSAFAQDDGPILAVQAPTAPVQAGQIVWIKTDGSVFDDIVWQSGAPDHSWSLAADKRSAMFQSMTESRYLFVIAACRNNKIALRYIVIEVKGGCLPNPPQPGPEPSPNPGPNPTPTPVTKLSETVKELAERLVPLPYRSRSKDLAESIRATCSRIAALPTAYGPRTSREAFRQASIIAMKQDVAHWEAFSKALSGEISVAMPSQNPTVMQIVDVYRQVADGLSEVK